jgi:hypothetical protein
LLGSHGVIHVKGTLAGRNLSDLVHLNNDP